MARRATLLLLLALITSSAGLRCETDLQPSVESIPTDSSTNDTNPPGIVRHPNHAEIYRTVPSIPTTVVMLGFLAGFGFLGPVIAREAYDYRSDMRSVFERYVLYFSSAIALGLVPTIFHHHRVARSRKNVPLIVIDGKGLSIEGKKKVPWKNVGSAEPISYIVGSGGSERTVSLLYIRLNQGHVFEETPEAKEN